MNILFRLEGRAAVPESDPSRWVKWRMSHQDDCNVAKSVVGPDLVSTVFLGVDYSMGQGPLQIFETLWDGGTKRYATWREAQAGHDDIVLQLLREGKS